MADSSTSLLADIATAKLTPEKPRENMVLQILAEKKRAREIEDKLAEDENKRIPADQQAKALPIAKEQGIPVDVARRNLPALEADQKQASVDKAKADVPSYAKLLADRDHGPIAMDALDEMPAFERIVRGTGQAWTQGWQSVRMNEIMSRRAEGSVTPAELAEYAKLQAEQKAAPNYNLGMFEAIPSYVTGSVPQMADTTARSLPAIGAGAVTGAATGAAIGAAGGTFTMPGAGTVAGAGGGAIAGGIRGAATGWWLGQLHGNFRQLGGEAYGEAIAAKDENGNPLPEDVAKGIYYFAGTLGAGSEVLPMEKLLHTVPGVGKYLTKVGGKGLISLAMKSPAARASIARIGRLLEVGGVEAATEVFQELTKLEPIIAAGGVTDGNDQNLADQRTSRYFQSGWGGFWGGVGMAGIGETTTAATNKVQSMRTARAETRQKALIELGDKIRASKINSTSPDTILAHAQQMDKDGAAPPMTAPAEALVNLFQSEGMPPEEVQLHFPDVAQALTEATQTNADVPLTSETLFKLARLPGFSGLTEDIRVGGEPSAREAKAGDAELAATIKDMSTEDVARAVQASAQSEVAKQLVATGHEPRAADTMARAHISVLSNLAARNKMTLDQIMGQFPLQITSNESTDTAAAPDEMTLAQRDVLARSPELQEGMRKLQAGEITKADYAALVDKYKPVEPYAAVPEPATVEAMQGALTEDKVSKIGAPDKLEEGHPVGLRLDIPAYARHGTWVVSVHDQKAGFAAGPSIGYSSVARATNVELGVVQNAAVNIAGGKPKATIAVMKGSWKPTTPEQAKADADAALTDPAWRQIGMDPERHAYFYDRETMQPITNAEEVIQIGPLVLGKNVTYGDKETFLFQSDPPVSDMTGAPLSAEEELDESIEDLDNELEDEGFTGARVDQVDALVEDKDIPVITLRDLIGKKIFPTIADRTAAAALYTGIDGSKLNIAIPLLGGPYFPLRVTNWLANVVWANRGKGVTSQKAARLKDGANYMLVVMGDANMHQSNTTVSRAFFGTLEAYARDGRVSAKSLSALSKMVTDKAAGMDPVVEIKAKNTKALEKAAARTEPLVYGDRTLTATQDVNKKLAKMKADLAAFPGFADEKVLDDYLDGISFDARKEVLRIMGTKEAKAFGVPSMEKILAATIQPQLAGHRWGDGVLLVELDQTNPQVDLGTEGTTQHPDFPLGIRGKVVGKLNTPINYETLWADWLHDTEWEANAKNIADGTPNKPVNVRRAFELSKPIVEVTQDLVDRIGKLAPGNIEGHRQARLAADFALGNWRDAGTQKNQGGLSIQGFIDALAASEASATLSPPGTASELKAAVKKGKLQIKQLGDGQIFYALKDGSDYEWAGVPALPGDKTLTSVVNNELGASGIAAPAVLIDAIANGATVLDCFAVKSSRFPGGFLPALYSAFGFEVAGRVPFDPEQFSGNLADAEAFWTKYRWNKDDGYPDVVVMRWKGSDADRQGVLERYLRSGAAGILARGASANAQASWSELNAPDREEAATAGSGADAGRARGDQGAGDATSVASRAQSIVRDLANLTDAEARNLGLTAEDRDKVAAKLNESKAPSPGPSSSGEITLNQSDLSFFDPSLKPLIKDRDVKASALRTIDQLVQIASGMKSWRDWYARYEQVLIDFLGSPEEAQLFQDILSATSQAASVKANVGLAIKAYDQMKSGQPFTGYLPAVIGNLNRIRENQAVQGRKIGQYGEASNGNAEAIAVDRHIAMVIFGVKAPSPRQIEEAKGMLREVAKILGWAPREVQAALWAGNQILLGTPEENIGSYDDVLLKKGEPLKQLFRDIQSRNGDVRGTGGSATAVGAAAGGTAEGQADGTQTLNQNASSTQTFARGSISFTPARNKFTMTLTGRADLSTFNHEAAHYYLELIQALVANGTASPQLVADLEKIRAWMGLKPGEQIERRHHELFARGYEAYLMEGRAPSAELQTAFSRFRAWMVFIYKRLSALNVELTDEVRGVMDRLVASDAAIAEARTNIGFEKPLPKEALYLSDEEYDRYVEAWNKAADAQQREVDARLMLEAAREAQEVWKDERRKMFDEEEKALKDSRGYKAWKLLTEGEGLDDAAPGRTELKIDPETVPAEWRRDATGTTAEGGLPLETVAEVLGFDSGEQMLSVIAGAKFALRDLPARVQKMMEEKHGALDMTTLADLATDAVQSDKTQEVLLTEYRAMADKAGLSHPPTGMLKWMAGQAKKSLMNLTRRQLDPVRWRRAQLKAAAESARAAAKGDMNMAVVKKRQQMMAAAMERATIQAEKRIETIRKKLKPFLTNARRAQLGKAGDLYLDAIDEILEGVQFKGMSAAAVKKLDRLSKLVEEADAKGEPLVLPDKLRAMLGKKNYADLTLEELEGIHDTVMNIWHLAKTKNELRARAETRALETVLTDMEQTAQSTMGQPKIREAFVRTKMDRVKSLLRMGRAQLVKMEFLFSWFDGQPSGGMMHRYIYQPLADASQAEYQIMKRFKKELIDRMRAMPAAQKARWESKRKFMGRDANGATIIAAALNLGNVSNKEKLLKGYGWTEQQLMDEVNAFMTKADWDMVQHIWDQIDTLWPQIEETTRQATGLRPEKVAASPVVTPHGTYSGGYYPVVYDPDLTEQAFKNQQKEKDLFSSNYVRPTLGDGFTKARVDYAAPILLDLSVISRHLSEVVHYVTHYEAVTQADKLTKHPRFQALIKGYMGNEFYREIRPWLQDIARAQDSPTVTQREILSKGLKGLRGGVSVASMGYNVFTGLKQLYGVTTALDAISPGYWMAGIAKTWMSPDLAKNWRFAMSSSYELEQLITSYDRDVKMMNDAYAKEFAGGAVNAVVRHAFSHIGMFQLAVNVAVWQGAYDQAQGRGLDHEAAVKEADSVVRTTQSAGAIKDLSAVQRGSEASRMVSMFYTWFSVLYNRLEDIARQQKTIADVPRTARRLAVLVVLSAMIEETGQRAYQMAMGSGDDDKKDDPGYILSVLMKSGDMIVGTVPLLRAFVSFEGASKGLTPEITPITRVGNDYWRALQAAEKLAVEGKSPTRSELKAAVKTVSVATGKPLSGIYNLVDEFFGEAIFGKK